MAEQSFKLAPIVAVMLRCVGICAWATTFERKAGGMFISWTNVSLLKNINIKFFKQYIEQNFITRRTMIPLSAASPRLQMRKSKCFSCGLSTAIGAILPALLVRKNIPNQFHNI